MFLATGFDWQQRHNDRQEEISPLGLPDQVLVTSTETALSIWQHVGGRGYAGLCDCTHDRPLILILSPFFKVGGAVVMMFSPPTSPSTNAPSLRWLRV